VKKRILLLIVLATTFGSCSVYKNGQTPDDVYYSPTKEIPAYVETEDDARNDEATSPEDRYLRMKSTNRNRWSAFDDDVAYWNNPTWNNSFYFNSFGSPYYSPWIGSGWNVGIGTGWGWNNWGWNSWGRNNWGWNGFGGIGNPFCPGFYGSPIVVVNPKTVNYKSYAPRGGNLNAYSRINGYTDPKTGQKVYGVSSGNASAATLRTYRTSGGNYYNPSTGSTRNSGGSPSRSFNSNNSGSRSSGTTNTGSSNSGSRSSGSSGGSSGGSAPVRSFPRGGGK